MGVTTLRVGIEAEAAASQSAATTARFIFEWISRHGIPEKVIADNGPHFTSKDLTDYMTQSYGLNIKFTVGFHPQRQGRVERANRTVKTLLKKLALCYVGSWDMWLPAALFVIRTAVRSDHTYSPFFLVYGRQPRVPDMMHEFDEEVDIDEEDTLMERIESIKRLHQDYIPIAIQRMEVYKEKMKSQYDKSAKRRRYIPGDKVMAVNRAIRLIGSDLLTQWLGPSTIHKSCGNDTYQLRDEDLILPSPYHANQLKLYVARPKVVIPLREKGLPHGSGTAFDEEALMKYGDLEAEEDYSARYTRQEKETGVTSRLHTAPPVVVGLVGQFGAIYLQYLNIEIKKRRFLHSTKTRI